MARYSVKLADGSRFGVDVEGQSPCPDRCGHTGDMSHTYEETVHVKQFWSGTLVDLITREQALRIWEQQPEEYRTEHAEVYRKFFDIP